MIKKRLKKKNGEKRCKYGVGESVGPQNRVIRKLKITMFGGGRRGFRTISVLPGLTGSLGSCWDLCSQITWAVWRAYPALWLLLFGTWSDFCSLPNPTIPEMLRVGILRKSRSGTFCKQNIPVLGRPGFESLTCGFLGMVCACASPSRGTVLQHSVWLPREWGCRGNPDPAPISGPRSRDTESLIHMMALLSFQTISSNSRHLMWNLFFPLPKAKEELAGVTQHTQLGVPLEIQMSHVVPSPPYAMTLSAAPQAPPPPWAGSSNDQGTHCAPRFAGREGAQSLECLKGNGEQLEILF